MKKTILAYFLIAFTFSSCNFSSDSIESLEIKEKGLSCETPFISSTNKNDTNTTFTYGESFEINFNMVEGLTKENERLHPGLELLITNIEGDTIMYDKDLYKESDGYALDELLLQAKITAAKPMHSNETYKVKALIYDKKGDGTYEAKLNFNVVPNDHISVKTTNATFDDVYLFSKDRNETLFVEEAFTNEKVYIIVEGLQGFKTEQGKASIGIRIKGTDDNGNTVVNEPDLMKNKLISAKDIHQQIAAYFTFKDGKIHNPIHCELTIWDKKSDHELTATTDISFIKRN